MTTYVCQKCGTHIPTGLATVRTTLRAGVLVSLAWCRVCRPVRIPTQRTSVNGKVEA